MKNPNWPSSCLPACQLQPSTTTPSPLPAAQAINFWCNQALARKG